MKTKPKVSNFVNIQVWRESKIVAVRQLKKRNRGKGAKQTLAQYMDDLIRGGDKSVD